MCGDVKKSFRMPGIISVIISESFVCLKGVVFQEQKVRRQSSHSETHL